MANVKAKAQWQILNSKGLKAKPNGKGQSKDLKEKAHWPKPTCAALLFVDHRALLFIDCAALLLIDHPALLLALLLSEAVLVVPRRGLFDQVTLETTASLLCNNNQSYRRWDLAQLGTPKTLSSQPVIDVIVPRLS